MAQRVLVCDAVDVILPKILKDNGMEVDYKPEVTQDELLRIAKQ